MIEKEPLSRRDFLKKAGLAAIGAAGGALGLSRFFKETTVEPEPSPLLTWSGNELCENEKVYDVVIVGCGMAGAVAGLTALKRNLNVCIVEKNEREFIGRKICGELTQERIVEWLKNEFNLSITCYPLKGLEIRCSSGYTSRSEGSLCMIDRWQVQQAIFENLLERGADVYQGTVKGPVLESFVKGVKTENATFHSAVTIDCSGVSSVLRRKLFSEGQLLGIAYKENLILKEPVETEYALLLLDKKIIPSGYAWCFPKNEYEVNVGVGGLEGGVVLEETLGKVINILGIEKKIVKREFPGYGLVPLGRPLPSMVYPGFLVCGDAASHVNPLTGGGIAPAVTAGYLAATTSVKAVENNDVSTKGMWDYNYDFARGYGVKHASLVVARNFLLSLSDEDMTYFLENIVTGDDLSQLMGGKVPSQEGDMMKTFYDHWRKPSLLYQMYRAFKQMTEIRNHYSHYPERPEEFSAWRETLDQYVPHNKKTFTLPSYI